MKPKDLLSAHRYSEAVDAYRAFMLEHPDQNYNDGLGRALLSLERYSEAFEAFRKANEIESQRLEGCQPNLNDMGTALWLFGKKEDAMSIWHQAAAGILDGSIGYGDLAGGGRQGLLLWYATLTLKNASERDYALKYLRTRVKGKAYATDWPRPIVQMVLDQVSFSDVLKIGGASDSLEVCLVNSKDDLLKRRRVCQAVFYRACQALEAGNEVECKNLMRICSGLENPIIECEWYLARGE